MISSLLSIVAKATLATMSMLVAADKPPKNTISASQGCSAAIGMVRTKVSGSTSPSGNISNPPSASGKTNRLISNR